MKIPVTLVASQGMVRDVTLSCDATATVADVARSLIRADAGGDPRLIALAATRVAPVTLLGWQHGSDAPVLLDPCTPAAVSGLQSGWVIEPVAEFSPARPALRLIEAAGYAEVRSGRHAGVVYSLLAGANVIGRDPSCRVHLGDASVSRRHAVLEIGAQHVLRDLGSANGLLVDGEAASERRVEGPCTLTLGEVELRVVLGPPPVIQRERSHRTLHTRPPRVTPRFPSSEHELPAPPEPPSTGGIPILAVLAPMLMGGAVYAATRSPMSLLMVAFSPVMMIGSWLDGRLGGARRHGRELARFEEALRVERDELRELRDREIRVRAAEAPGLADVIAAIGERNGLLWTRRPEHRRFLEVKLGEGSLPSRTAVVLPPRGGAAGASWRALRDVEAEFREVGPVPVLERLDRCGALGVAGEPRWADGMARSLVMQLVGLHSPAELVVACFARPGQAEAWGWLKWLPHVDPTTSPIGVWQLADDIADAARLLTSLEELLAARLARAGSSRTVRSRAEEEDRADDAGGAGPDALPVTPCVLVLVLDDGCTDRSRLISLAETGPDAGIHVIWIGETLDEIPAACRTYVEFRAGEGRVGFVRSGKTVLLQRLELLDATVALAAARRLSPVEDAGARVLDESDLPRTVDLRELHSADLIGGAPPILRAWAASGSLTARWREGEERAPIALAAVVGQGAEGPAALDLRAQGPHALVGGTTGAGKSEFLQTWLMSMAANVSPDRLTFLLVDYKGGAAFAECVDLPHTVGLVTDLNPRLVRRALTSLRAELRHREELLVRHGAKDLIAMERRSDPAAPPMLVIAIDEFAALAADVPEFVDGVIDIAQRGRSLGLHLIMATQRPAGVIKDGLRANTNLRVALRMADEADSIDVIGVRDAALFDAAVPGRGAIKVGAERIGHFQTGYLGGRASTTGPAPHIGIRSLRFAEGAEWEVPPDPGRGRRSRADQPRDIERLRDGIVDAARLAGLVVPRRPWLDALPSILDLARLREAANVDEGTGERAGAGDAALIALRDEPAAQAQRPCFVDLEQCGNVAFVGASGTGKTSALLTLAAALSIDADRSPVHLYAIDAAGGALGALAALPTAGAVAPLSDMELVGRVLQHILDAIAERGPRYAASRAAGLSAYRGAPGGEREPRLVLMLDGLGPFRQATETLGAPNSPFQKLVEIMTTGRSVGVHVALTADRPSGIPASLASALQQQWVLRLASPHEYGHAGVRSDALENAPPGRAVIVGAEEELQIALYGARPELDEQARSLERLASALQRRGTLPAPLVRNAPRTLPLRNLPTETEGRPVYGIDTRSFAPVGLPARGLGVVAGPSGSGLSTAALACVEAMVRRAAARGGSCETTLLTFTLDGLRGSRDWGRVACGEEEVRDLARGLVLALGGRPAALARGAPGGVIGARRGRPDVTPPSADEPRVETGRPALLSAGARSVIVIERPADAEGTEALGELVALARAARRAEALVLFEFEQGTGGPVWELLSALRQPNWGLALQPDEGESQSPFRESFGRTGRADFPPGRGFAVESGRVTPVQVALPAPL
ncbi:FtsK/SpoIIIE domain-containing protein [Leucobacter sp. wl10]|uniref:FtsK/SpoIIIE domain-containing protein n=1 Tax=Leucobacter sp. wl10 TaxID=2304677 RepID=UPI000E5A6E5F|nr:FtsK/SpoIIIE domain-containing protein [Leucobacter sp. wl10]RGE19472.1 FHA domain-containing protein [Leucobacter sp. wl10]